MVGGRYSSEMVYLDHGEGGVVISCLSVTKREWEGGVEGTPPPLRVRRAYGLQISSRSAGFSLSNQLDISTHSNVSFITNP